MEKSIKHDQLQTRLVAVHTVREGKATAMSLCAFLLLHNGRSFPVSSTPVRPELISLFILT
jgi:hypothetical protein